MEHTAELFRLVDIAVGLIDPDADSANPEYERGLVEMIAYIVVPYGEDITYVVEEVQYLIDQGVGRPTGDGAAPRL